MTPGALTRTDPVEGLEVCDRRLDVGVAGAAMGVGGVSAGVEGAPSSRTDGSWGGGPSRAQRRDSYLERM